jgi:hypothetical protein
VFSIPLEACYIYQKKTCCGERGIRRSDIVDRKTVVVLTQIELLHTCLMNPDFSIKEWLATASAFEAETFSFEVGINICDRRFRGVWQGVVIVNSNSYCAKDRILRVCIFTYQLRHVAGAYAAYMVSSHGELKQQGEIDGPTVTVACWEVSKVREGLGDFLCLKICDFDCHWNPHSKQLLFIRQTCMLPLIALLLHWEAV